MKLREVFRKTNRTHRPASNPASGTRMFSRREVINAIRNTAIAGAVTAVVGGISAPFVKRRYDAGNAERTKHVDSMRDFLEGKDSARRVKLFGSKEYSYDELVTTLSAITTPPCTPEETRSILSGLGYMMMVEDSFGTKMDTNPDLEWLDRHVPFVSFANSFGLGQVNAYSARSAILQNMDTLMAQGVMDAERIAILQPDVPPEKAEAVVNEQAIKQALNLDMYQEGNLLSAFLVFHQGANLYSRWPKGNGKINMNREKRAGLRGFNLAVAAYSASGAAPTNAEGQALMNELGCLGFIQGFDPKQPLQVDGSLGKKGGRTRALMDTVTAQLSLTPLAFRVEEARTTYKGREYGYEKRCELMGMKAWVEELKTRWDARVIASDKGLISLFERMRSNSPTLDDINAFRTIIAGRHSLVFQTTYSALQDHGDRTEAGKLLAVYVRDRSGDFLKVIGDPPLFAKHFPQGDYTKFMLAVTGGEASSGVNTFMTKLDFDSNFPGIIPTAYLNPKWPGKDPANIMERAKIAVKGSSAEVEEP